MPDPPDQNYLQNAVTIPIDDTHSAIIDKEWAPALCLFHWRPIRRRRCYYAYADIHFREYNGKLSMSRIVAQTPPGQVCHHRNRNSLDNRAANLVNLTQKDHKLLHRNHSLTIKYQQNTPPKPESVTQTP